MPSTGSARPKGCSDWPTSTGPSASRRPAGAPSRSATPSYRTVKGIFVAGTENDGEFEAVQPAAPAHLHGPVGLFDHLGDEAAAR